MAHLVELTDAELDLVGGGGGIEDLIEDIFDAVEEFLEELFD